MFRFSGLDQILKTWERITAPDFVRLLEGPTFDLSKYKIIQDFYCHSGAISALVHKIVSILSNSFFSKPLPWKPEANLLIWTTSGFGKTFLVTQLHSEMKARTGKTIEYVRLPLHEIISDRPRLTTELQKVRDSLAAGNLWFVLFDEADKWDFDYTEIHASADWSTVHKQGVVCVFVGSGGGSLKGAEGIIESRLSGKDLLSRIPFKFAFPQLTAEDKVVIACSMAKSYGFVRIDKAALIAIAMSKRFESSREIHKAIEYARITYQGDYLTYFALYIQRSQAMEDMKTNPRISKLLDVEEAISVT